MKRSADLGTFFEKKQNVPQSKQLNENEPSTSATAEIGEVGSMKFNPETSVPVLEQSSDSRLMPTLGNPNASEVESNELNSSTTSLPFVETLDISNALGKSLSSTKRFNYITNAWTPEKKFVFPIVELNGKKRFRHEWLELFPWLAYSKTLKGGFCKICVGLLFSSKEGGIGGQVGKQKQLKFMVWFEKYLDV